MKHLGDLPPEMRRLRRHSEAARNSIPVLVFAIGLIFFFSTGAIGYSTPLRLLMFVVLSAAAVFAWWKFYDWARAKAACPSCGGSLLTRPDMEIRFGFWTWISDEDARETCEHCGASLLDPPKTGD